MKLRVCACSRAFIKATSSSAFFWDYIQITPKSVKAACTSNIFIPKRLRDDWID